MVENIGKEMYSLSQKSAAFETCLDIIVTMIPIWVAVAIGLVVGWAWKPRWVSLILLGLRTRPRLLWSTPPGFGARRLWLAVTALSAFPMMRDAWVWFRAWRRPRAQVEHSPSSSFSGDKVTEKLRVTDEDLKHLCQLLDGEDDGPSWQPMMNKSAPNMSYQAWRRDPQGGPAEYRSRTLYEDVSPQIIRDFFWDDEFRLKWDNMIISVKTLEECPKTGFMMVHWVRKFPFFCKDREYIIARRIWRSGDDFYCIQKGVDHVSVPRQTKPRRVDIFYSSFRIRAVDSQKAIGKLTSCEVLLFHHEEMGIQRDIAKLGVGQGMWGCVKMIEAGVRNYISVRSSGKLLSKSALMAQICTPVPSYLLADSSSSHDEVIEEKKYHASAWKWVVLGGAVALACGVDRGAVGRVLLFGIARRLGRLGRRL